MNKAVAFTSGIGLGSGLMYFFDPDRGRRRRALVRDKTTGVVRDTSDVIRKASLDIKNRAKGIVAEARSLVTRQEIPDDILQARVQTKLGRLVSHPHAVEVTADDGEITLRGAVLASEVEQLVRGISSMRGVVGVRNRLEVHQRAEDVPALQGGRRRTGSRPDILQAAWSPATRLIAGAAGGALAAYGLTHRGAWGAGATAMGAALLTRGISNKEMTRLFKTERAA